MSAATMTAPQTTIDHENHSIHDVQTTRCVVVGGGPAGAMLALMLARKNIPVTLLESHADFDREFRGDTIHPSAMQNLAELGLAEKVHQLRHTKVASISVPTNNGMATPIDLRRLKTRFPYITVLPQKNFLEFLTAEAQRYPSFRLIMSARVEELIEEGGAIRGVRYQGPDGWHELRAVLTVGADGRFSRVRKLARIEPIKTSPPMDILWFKLTRRADDPEETMGRFGNGHILAMINRFDYWQCGFVIPKGRYQMLHAAGLDDLKRQIVELMPLFADRIDELREWKQVSLLSVESSRCPRWYKPGLLLIGDAAHVMSPVGGVGINYAIQDAVVAANVLAAPLRAGCVLESDLRAIQRKRELPTRFIQALQTQLQKRVIAGVLNTTRPVEVPPVLKLLSRIPIVRDIPARIVGLGLWPVHVRA